MAKTKIATLRMFPGDYQDLLRALKRPTTRIIADLREVHQPCSMADDPEWPAPETQNEMAEIFRRLPFPMRIAGLLVAAEMKAPKWRFLCERNFGIRAEKPSDVYQFLPKAIRIGWRWFQGRQMPPGWRHFFSDISMWLRWECKRGPMFHNIARPDLLTAEEIDFVIDREWLVNMLELIDCISAFNRDWYVEEIYEDTARAGRFFASAIADVMHPGEWRAWWNRMRSRFAVADFNAIALGTAPSHTARNADDHHEGGVEIIRIRRRRRRNSATNRQLQASFP